VGPVAAELTVLNQGAFYFASGKSKFCLHQNAKCPPLITLPVVGNFVE
jgi:hypothetical protein